MSRNIWDQVYQIPYKRNFIRKKLSKFQITFSKNHWESKFKMSEVGKEEDLGRKPLKQKTQNKFLCKSDFKEWVKNYLFFSFDRKGKIPHQVFFQRQENTQFCCQQFFLTPINSLAVCIIGTDTLWRRHLHLECKECNGKKKIKDFV